MSTTTSDESPVLSITVETFEIWDSKLKTISTEYRYHFSVDGTDFGVKCLDGSTRQYFLKLVFEIADELSNSNNSVKVKEEVKRKIKLLGESMYRLVVSPKLGEYLNNVDLLTIRTTDHDLPWEILHDSAGFLCHRIALGRELPRSFPLNNSSFKRGINVCLIGDPTSDLPESKKEIAELTKCFEETFKRLNDTYGINTTLRILEHEHANKSNMLFEVLLSSDTQWDIIHFAGHAHFNSDHPESSSLVLADGELKAFELERLSSNPMLFVNACHSGLTVKNEAMKGYGLLKGIAPSFVKGGALGYVGSLWPIEDLSARKMSTTFYNSILEGAGIGEALLDAKRTLLNQNLDIASVGYVLYGNPVSKLPVFEPVLTDGPYVNERGFERILELESEYGALEILLANDLPWILWQSEDFSSWVSRIPATEKRRLKMQNMLNEYKRHFRNLILNNSKEFIGIINIRTLRKYLKEKKSEERAELFNDLQFFCRLPNFVLLFYDGDEEEIEEIEIVSKNKDVLLDLRESAYVFNKQVRFEQSPVNYSLHINYNPSLIKEYADRFFNYYQKNVNQYIKKHYKSWKGSAADFPRETINTITMGILNTELKKNL